MKPRVFLPPISDSVRQQYIRRPDRLYYVEIDIDQAPRGFAEEHSHVPAITEVSRQIVLFEPFIFPTVEYRLLADYRGHTNPAAGVIPGRLQDAFVPRS